MRVGAACLDWLGAAMHNTVPTLCCMITFIYELQYPVIHFTISAKVLNSPRGLPRDSSKEELRLSYWKSIQRCYYHICLLSRCATVSTALGMFYHCMGNMVHYTVFGRKLPLLLLLPYILKLCVRLYLIHSRDWSDSHVCLLLGASVLIQGKHNKMKPCSYVVFIIKIINKNNKICICSRKRLKISVYTCIYI